MTSYMQPERQDRIMVKQAAYITDYTDNFMSDMDIIFCIILHMESTRNKKGHKKMEEAMIIHYEVFIIKDKHSDIIT